MRSIIQNGINNLLELTGLDGASLKILICTLLSFPFSIIFKRLPDNNYTLKNLYNILVSCFYIFGICNLRSGIVTLLISASGTYFITRYVRTSSMPWINFIFLMSHMAYSHIHLQFFADYDRTVIDITGAQMILVMKLSAFGWNIYDGKQPKLSLNEYNKSRAIYKHPNLLPYIGYVFFYASLLTGPAFDFVDYERFIHSTMFDDVPSEKRPKQRRIPRSGLQATKKLLLGFFWAFLLVKSDNFVTADYMFGPDFMNKHGFIYRIFYMWILGFSFRLKYYAIWTMAEGACILCGIGYNGVDSKTGEFKWNRVQNIDSWAFELGQNIHTCLEAWNQNTNKWLKNYVYLRVAKPGRRPGFKSTLFTFATSAFWHGTRPGYYLTFVLGAFLQTLGKIYRRNFRPIFLMADGKTPRRGKPVYDFICWINTQLAFGFVVQPFVFLELPKSIKCWATVYFWLIGVVAATFFAFSGPFAKQVTMLLKSLQPSYVAQLESKKKEEKKKLNPQESKIVEKVVGSKLEQRYDSPTLGLPPFDVFQEFDKKEVDHDLKEFNVAWKSFRGRRGSITDDDFEGLKDAYSNFTNEINDIFQSKKEEFLKAKAEYNNTSEEKSQSKLD